MLARLLAPLVGLGFVAALLLAILTTQHEAAQPNIVEEFHKEPKAIHYASDGPLGRFDREQLQRGFQVFKEVCSACHSIRLVHFRDLEEIGFSKPEVKGDRQGLAGRAAVDQPGHRRGRDPQEPRVRSDSVDLCQRDRRARRQQQTRCRRTSR